MTTTTFKGARYITKFADPIEWDSTRAYEAIESVQHEGFTYISKQPVPVGVQIDNTDFWLLWADPNAQMEQLRQLVSQYTEEVSDLSDELDAEIDAREAADALLENKPLQGKTIMIFGDSTMVDTTQNTDRLADLISETCACNVIVKAVGGTALDHLISTLQNMTSSDFDNVDYAFFAYSTNDWQASTPISILNGENTFEGELKTAFDLYYSLAENTIPVLVTPAYGTRNFVDVNLTVKDKNFCGAELADYVDAYLNFAYENRIAVIDLFHSYGIRNENVSNYFFTSTGAGLDIYVHYKQNFKEQIAKDIEKFYPFQTPECPFSYGINTLDVSNQMPEAIEPSTSEMSVILQNTPETVKSFPAVKLPAGQRVDFKCSFSGNNTLIINHKAGSGLIKVYANDNLIALVTAVGQIKIRINDIVTNISSGKISFETVVTQYICAPELFNGNCNFSNNYSSQNWQMFKIPQSWIAENGSFLVGYLATGTEFNILHFNGLEFTESKATGATLFTLPVSKMPIRNYMIVGAAYITGTGYTPMLFIGERVDSSTMKVMASTTIPANTKLYIEQVIPNYRGYLSNTEWA